MSDTLGFDLYLQRQIRELRAELHDFENQTSNNEAQLAKAILGSKRRLYDLTTLMATMIDTLEAAGVLDKNVLEARLEARRLEDPWSAEHPEPLTTAKPYHCNKCYIALAMEDGQMTPNGMMCKQCGW